MRGSIVKRTSKRRAKAKAKDKPEDGAEAKPKRAPALYYAVYYVDGIQKWEAVPPTNGRAVATRKDAEALLSKRVTEIQGGEFIAPRRITFGAFRKLWMERYAEGEGEIRASTLSQYRQFFRTHLGPAFDGRQLTALKVEDVQAYKVEKLKGLSPQTVKHHLRLLRQMLRHAIDWGYLRVNVAEKVTNPTIPKREMDALAPEELHAFLEKVPEKWQAFFVVTVAGGLRIGEVLGMRWANLDRKRGQYFVRETWLRGRDGGKAAFGPPKSASSIAAVDLPREVFAALDEHRARQKAEKLAAGPDYQDQGLVFATATGGPLDDKHVVGRVFNPALETAGLRRIRFHDLRHTTASLLIHGNENPKYIQKQMRHASIEMTFNTYGHLFPDANREAAGRLGETIFGRSKENLTQA